MYVWSIAGVKELEIPIACVQAAGEFRPGAEGGDRDCSAGGHAQRPDLERRAAAQLFRRLAQ